MAKNNTSNIKGYTIEVITPVPSVPFPEMPTVIFLFIPPDIFYANHTSIYMGVYVCVHMHLNICLSDLLMKTSEHTYLLMWVSIF